MQRAFVPSLCLASLLAGCPSPSGGFGAADLAVVFELPIAALGEPYEGRAAVDSEDPASFSLGGGELPPGLALREDGQISGAPSWLGASSFVVIATLSSGRTAQAEASITVQAGAASVFPGFARQPHVAPSQAEYLGDLWMRIGGGGEAGQDRLSFAPGLYVAGADGLASGGGGDDERVFDLRLGTDAQLAVGQWSPSQVGEPDDPPIWEPEAGEFVAREQAGRRSLSLSADGFDVLPLFLAVVPPDWCPLGEHPRGGPSPGACE